MERRTSSLNRLSSWRSSPRSFRARDSTWSGTTVLLAPAAKWRPYVVPSTALPDSPGHPGCRPKSAGTVDLLPEVGCSARQRTPSRPRNYSWAELLHPVFSVDVLECPKCSGRMRILAAINPPAAIRKILDCLGIPSRAPPIAAASRADDGGLEVS